MDMTMVKKVISREKERKRIINGLNDVHATTTVLYYSRFQSACCHVLMVGIELADTMNLLTWTLAGLALSAI